jgi:hypothetical protein
VKLRYDRRMSVLVVGVTPMTDPDAYVGKHNLKEVGNSNA